MELNIILDGGVVFGSKYFLSLPSSQQIFWKSIAYSTCFEVTRTLTNIRKWELPISTTNVPVCFCVCVCVCERALYNFSNATRKTWTLSSFREENTICSPKLFGKLMNSSLHKVRGYKRMIDHAKLNTDHWEHLLHQKWNNDAEDLYQQS